MVELWSSYNRLWGRIEGTGYAVQYVSPDKLPGMTGGIYWDRNTVEISRIDPPKMYDVPDASIDPKIVLVELCVLAHELGHIHSKRADEKRWNLYFYQLSHWHSVRSLSVPLSKDRAELIFEEEERAEMFGERIIREIHRDALSEFRRRADGSLGNYRRQLEL